MQPVKSLFPLLSSPTSQTEMLPGSSWLRYKTALSLWHKFVSSEKENILDSQTLTGMSYSSSNIRLSMKAIANQFYISETTIRCVLQEDIIRYKSFVMWIEQFIPSSIRENRVMYLWNKFKRTEEPNMLCFSQIKILFKIKNIYIYINRRNGRWRCASPTEVSTVMHSKNTVICYGLRRREQCRPGHASHKALRGMPPLKWRHWTHLAIIGLRK